MSEPKPLYPWSRKESARLGEEELWLESYRENCICARAIERTISDGYAEYRLDKSCAKKAIEEYGFDRVNFVLANTVQEHMDDGRYSADNKQWAQGFFIVHDRDNWNNNYSVDVHPGLVDVFISQARKEWQKLGLLDSSQCYDESEERLDYTGKVVIVRPDILKDEYKTPDDQLVYAYGGNGCRPNAIGVKVYGKFLKDGEKTCFSRNEIIGVMKLELLPDWAKARIAELTGKAEEVGQDNTATPDSAEKTMGLGETE